MSEPELNEGEVCPPNSRLDNWMRLIAGLVLMGVVLVDMLDLWSKEPPAWFLAVLFLLAAGVEVSAIRKIALDAVRKYAEKK